MNATIMRLNIKYLFFIMLYLSDIRYLFFKIVLLVIWLMRWTSPMVIQSANMFDILSYQFVRFSWNVFHLYPENWFRLKIENEKLRSGQEKIVEERDQLKNDMKTMLDDVDHIKESLVNKVQSSFHTMRSHIEKRHEE